MIPGKSVGILFSTMTQFGPMVVAQEELCEKCGDQFKIFDQMISYESKVTN